MKPTPTHLPPRATASARPGLGSSTPHPHPGHPQEGLVTDRNQAQILSLRTDTAVPSEVLPRETEEGLAEGKKVPPLLCPEGPASVSLGGRSRKGPSLACGVGGAQPPSLSEGSWAGSLGLPLSYPSSGTQCLMWH